MSDHLTPLLTAAIGFAYVGGLGFVVVGAYLTYRRRRLHPLLLVCISAISISWIEAPYDWAMYAQFAPAIPRMPSWWPLNMTWGGLPASVPPGYISYFVLPALIGAGIGRRLSARFRWRRPLTLLTVGFFVGFCWAFLFNAILGARLGIFYYGRVIPGLALWQGSKHQYPVYDAVAMGVQMMVFAYLLGRTTPDGRTVIDTWADKVSSIRLGSAALSIVGVVLLGNLLYGAVFAPHLITKTQGWVTAGPTERLFPGVPNQPLTGTARGPASAGRVAKVVLTGVIVRPVNAAPIPGERPHAGRKLRHVQSAIHRHPPDLAEIATDDRTRTGIVDRRVGRAERAHVVVGQLARVPRVTDVEHAQP